MAKKSSRAVEGGHFGAALLWLVTGFAIWHFERTLVGFLGGFIALFLLGIWLWVMISLIKDTAIDVKRRFGSSRAAAAKRQSEVRAREEAEQREDALGRRYASIVEATLAAVNYEIGKSEAARAGLLGDVDFDVDIRGITHNFRKAHQLQKVADALAVLDKPNADDRKILAEAKETVGRLEAAALNRVRLIANCATEAQLIDKSLRDERQESKTAQQRAELHARLSGLLYEIEATPEVIPAGSAAADAVMARVLAYRDIKKQIELAREE